MRYYSILLVVLSASALVLAASGTEPARVTEPAPVTKPAPVAKAAPVKVSKGDIKWARPVECIPPTHGNRRETRQFHPVVVVSDVDHNHEVNVAVVTHTPYKDIPAKPSSDYASFYKGGFVSVGRPKTINISKLKPVHKLPTTVEPEKLDRLIRHISENSPPDQWHLSEGERSLGGHPTGRERKEDMPRDKGKAKAQESRSPDRKGVSGRDGKSGASGSWTSWRNNLKTLERSNSESGGRKGDMPRDIDKGKAKAQESRSPDRKGVGRDGESGRGGWTSWRNNLQTKAQESRSPDRKGVMGRDGESGSDKTPVRSNSESRGRPRDKGKAKSPGK